eukprot:4703196-Pyramimonas_sp.AAC.1
MEPGHVPPPPPRHPETRGRKRKGPAEPSPRPWDEETDSECDSDEPRDPEAGMSFVNELIEMYLLGKPMNARHMSVLCHYAWKGGLLEAKPYAVNPESKGRNHQRKIDKALNLERFDARLYNVDAPGHDRNDPEITSLSFHVTPPHEALAAELEAHPEILE